MDISQDVVAPLSPRPSVRRPILKKTATAPAAVAPGARRASAPDALHLRRTNTALSIPIPSRPVLRRLQRESERSVQFSPDMLAYRAAPTPRSGHTYPPTPTYPALRTPTQGVVTLFGVPTRYRPLWLLAIGNLGLAGFGMGSVLVQRAIWPVRAYDGLNPGGITVFPGGAAGHGRAFGGITQGIVAGSLFIGVGIFAAVTSSFLFLQDGRKLNRAQNPQNPNYRRTHAYFAAHQTGIALLVGHRFFQEAIRSSLPPQAAWAIALPGSISQAIYSVTMAQSFSSSELACGTMPIKNRAVVAASARAMVASYIVLGALVATPNVSAYGRETVRIITAIAQTISFSLPLTTARLAGPQADIPIGPERYRGDWSAMQAFALYVFCQLAGSIGAFWLSRARWPAAAVPPRPGGDMPPPDAQVQKFRGLPPPLQSLPADLDETAGAAIIMALSFIGCCYSFGQLHRDARPPIAVARLLLAASVGSVLLGQLFRALQEKASSHADFRLRWIAAVPGFMAQALAFVAVPEQYGNSEATIGNVPLTHRYRIIEACRFTGGVMWYLWAAECGIFGFPPVARQLTIWLATSATILGFSLPTTDTRRAATGPTPQHEVPNPFEM